MDSMEDMLKFPLQNNNDSRINTRKIVRKDRFKTKMINIVPCTIYLRITNHYEHVIYLQR